MTTPQNIEDLRKLARREEQAAAELDLDENRQTTRGQFMLLRAALYRCTADVLEGLEEKR